MTRAEKDEQIIRFNWNCYKRYREKLSTTDDEYEIMYLIINYKIKKLIDFVDDFYKDESERECFVRELSKTWLEDNDTKIGLGLLVIRQLNESF